MEQYILMGVCFGAWAATTAFVTWLMRESDSGFIVGSLLGLLTGAVAGVAYYQHLASCSGCI